jgi:hypothetical protein
METRNCLERVPDEDLTKQGRDDRRRSRQDGAHVTKVEVPDLGVKSFDPRYQVSYLHDRRASLSPFASNSPTTASGENGESPLAHRVNHRHVLLTVPYGQRHAVGTAARWFAALIRRPPATTPSFPGRDRWCGGSLGFSCFTWEVPLSAV